MFACAIYDANFSRPYDFLKERRLVTEDVHNNQFCFKEVLDPESNRNVFLLEHEVRSITIRCFIASWSIAMPRSRRAVIAAAATLWFLITDACCFGCALRDWNSNLAALGLNR